MRASRFRSLADSFRSSWLVLLIFCGTLLSASADRAYAQNDSESDMTQRESRAAFAPPEERAARDILLKSVKAVAPFVLTDAVRRQFPGTFGIDVSHYDFDRFDSRKSPPQCTDQTGYDKPACSCTIDWTKIEGSGLNFAYLKASDGVTPDLSFSRNWQALEVEHTGGRLYRGAYHFLRFSSDGAKQADAFVAAIGAIGGKKPPQLSPSLDMEPIASAPIVPGSDLDRACPQNRRGKDSKNRPVCDLWYTVAPADLVKLAEAWIGAVEQATGLPVTIYTTQSWWSVAVGTAGDNSILSRRRVWIARYTDYNAHRGPAFVPTWGGTGKKWGMPPLPSKLVYPAAAYTDAHFWQWTEASRITTPFPCNTQSGGDTDLSWVPLQIKEYKSVFGLD